MISLKKN